jgi:hypothetical protein
MGYILNTRKIFANFHITNAAAALAFLIIAWSVVKARKWKRFNLLLGIASLITLFEVFGFVTIRQNNTLLITDTGIGLFMTSLIPCVFNIIILAILDWFMAAEEKRPA